MMDDFLQPLHVKLTETKSSHNLHISKLINLVNCRKMVDFMSELFCTLQDLYPKYTGSCAKGQMNFEQFAKFCRDFEIFPRFCSKPALYRIFHALALMKEALKPNTVVKNTKRLLQQNSVSIMNPNSQTLAQRQAPETIDKNLFIEAVTLCAF